MSNAFTFTIDGRAVEVPSGESVLAAARRLGIDIPTLCYLEKCGPLNTCQVCLVKVNGRLVPSCGTKAAPGMVVESETTEVHEARRTALELLFSDHVGDCLSPCQRLCPLMLNIPVMLRQLEAGRLREANATVRGALPLAGVLGRLCHHPCEQGCRRGHWDEPAAIRDMEKFVTDWELGFKDDASAADMRGVLTHPDPLPLGEGTASARAGSADDTSANADLRSSMQPERETILPTHEPECSAGWQPAVSPTDSRQAFDRLAPCGLPIRDTADSQSALRIKGANRERTFVESLLAGEGRGEGEGGETSSVALFKPASSKQVVILGAGPTGLAAAYYLVRAGHAVTVVDRRAAAGGTLREVAESQLPVAVLDAEIAVLRRLGVEFKQGALGDPLTLDGLSRGFDAILVAVGELKPDEATKLGLPLAGIAVKADPNTCLTPVERVFAAGSCVRPQKQLVKAMAEGRAVAECINRFLRGQPARRPEKPFSSLMGRLDPAEVKAFLAGASGATRVSPCEACRSHSAREVAAEGSRCLHCDCHSSGNCVLQHYAQVYGADAGRFRSERRKFEQQRQPGGILFEQGKCIVCGICVKLCEQAAEPLGLTFVGRGFDVRVAASLNAGIEAGLQKVAEECVKQCPTGALVFAEKIGHAQ